MNNSDRSIRLTFIKMAQERYMQEVISDMKREITREDAIDSKELISSLRYRSSSSVAGTGQSELFFAKHGRFLDMGVRRGYPLSGPSETARLVKGRKKVKPRKIYAKIAYGRLNGLINELQYGFTEEVKKQILDLNKE